MRCGSLVRCSILLHCVEFHGLCAERGKIIATLAVYLVKGDRGLHLETTHTVLTVL